MSRTDVLVRLDGAFPNAHIGGRTGLSAGDAPARTLGRYVVAVVFDLYGEGSSDRANVQRIVHELGAGAATLERVARVAAPLPVAPLPPALEPGGWRSPEKGLPPANPQERAGAGRKLGPEWGKRDGDEAACAPTPRSA